MAAEESQPLPEVAPAKKKGGSKLVVIIVAVLLLGGAGGGAWWYLRAAPKTGAAAAAAESEGDPSKRGLLAFEPFLVNLADPGGGRFLKATIQVVVPDAKEAEELKEKQPVLLMQARSAILEVLTVQTA